LRQWLPPTYTGEKGRENCWPEERFFARKAWAVNRPGVIWVGEAGLLTRLLERGLATIADVDIAGGSASLDVSFDLHRCPFLSLRICCPARQRL